MAFSIFLFEISALEVFYLSALLECYLCVLAESRGLRIIIFLFASHVISKYPKTFAYHNGLHFHFCILLALYFLWSTS